MNFEQTVARQTEISASLGNAAANLKKVGVTNFSHTNITTRINSIEKNWAEFTKNHLHLCTLRDSSNAKDAYFSTNTYSNTEEEYLTALSYHYSCMEALPRPAALPTASGPAPALSTTVRQLPRIDLPRFSGKFADWVDFRDLFVSMVKSNPVLTNVERLHYLKTSMTGDAAQLLKNIATNGDNFERAWTILTSRFENKRLLVSAHLYALTCLPAVTNESAKELKRLIDGTSSSRGALQQLRRPVEHWDDLLVHITVQKLDSATRREWETFVGAKTEYPTFSELETFLAGRINTLEALETTNLPRSSGQSSHQNAKKSHHAANARESICSLCSGGHFILHCPDFRAKNPAQRREVVGSKNICYNCLGSHKISECRSAKRCQQCNGHHHTMLHSTTTPSDAPATTVHVASTSAATFAANATINAFVSLPAPDSSAQVLLATALVHVHDARGKRHIARALVDQGSETSFATDALVKKLQLSRQPATVPVHGIGGAHVSATRGRTSITISSRHHSNSSNIADVLILPSLTTYRPSTNTLLSDWTHLRSLELAEDFALDAPIELILGADIYSTIISDGLKRGPAGSPIAQHTRFGWILSGPISISDSKPLPLTRAVTSGHLCIRRQSLHTGSTHGGRHQSPTTSSHDEAGGMFATKTPSWRR